MVTPFDRPLLCCRHAHFSALRVIGAELLTTEFSHSGDPDLCWPGTQVSFARRLNRCPTFRSCDLDLDPMTFIQAYELDPDSLQIHPVCKCEYVKAFESYHLTDMNRRKQIINHTASNNTRDWCCNEIKTCLLHAAWPEGRIPKKN